MVRRCEWVIRFIGAAEKRARGGLVPRMFLSFTWQPRRAKCHFMLRNLIRQNRKTSLLACHKISTGLQTVQTFAVPLPTSNSQGDYDSHVCATFRQRGHYTCRSRLIDHFVMLSEEAGVSCTFQFRSLRFSDTDKSMSLSIYPLRF